MAEKIFFGENLDNYEEKTLCVFLLDNSESVASHLTIINNALHDYYQEIFEDELMFLRIEVALVSCDPESGIIQQPSLVENFTMPFIEVSKKTNLIAGIQMAIKVVEKRKQYYKENGIAYRRPWIILLSNGITDTEMLNINLKQIVDIRHDVSNKKYFVQPISISDDARLDFMEIIATAQVINIKDAKLLSILRNLSSGYWNPFDEFKIMN